MENRCDSVDALMYAYYAFMKSKEENRMLKKNKDYLEMRVSSTDCAFTQNEATQISIDGCVYTTYMDIPNPGELYVFISKEKFEKLKTENEKLKKKLEEFSPVPGYREFLTKIYPEGDVEKLVWATEQIFSKDRWKFWKDNYEALDKLIGFSSVKEIQDYLTNEAECDTLQEAISKLKDQVKYTCDEWYSANSRNNSWKAAAECNSPHELIEKREALEKEIGVYSRTLNEWKEVTGCPSPSAAKTLIESGASWMSAYHSSCEVIKTWKKLTGCPTPIAAKTLIESGMSYEHGYHEVQKENRKLTEEVDSWKNVTGYSTPEDYMHVRINNATPFDYTAAWQKATGCDTPDKAKERIKALNERIDESEADYNHLLCTTGFESEGEIEDALDKCDHSTLRKALVDYEFDYNALLKLTGYKSKHDIRVMLNDSEQFVYKDMRELINSLKRKAKFTESNWQAATGCDAPEKAQCKITDLYNRIDKMKEAASIASNWTDKIVEG